MFGSNKRIEWLRQELDELRKAHLELRDYTVKLTDDVNTWAQDISRKLDKQNKEKTK